MASNAFPAANIAPYIPEMWSLTALKAYESKLVIAQNLDRRYEKQLNYGDILNVPNLSNFGDATAVDLTVEQTLVTTIQNTTQIVVNYHYYKSIGEGYGEQAQDRPDFLTTALPKCAYSVAKILDDLIADLVNGLTTNTAGTEGSALIADTFIAAYEGLNESDVDSADRFWVLDPESITDIIGTDYFIRMDYGVEGVHQNGFEGRKILGSPVYMTTNLNVINTTYHAALYAQKEWVAIIQEVAPTVYKGDWWQKFTNVVGVRSLFGIKQMRETAGCWIKTRS